MKRFVSYYYFISGEIYELFLKGHFRQAKCTAVSDERVEFTLLDDQDVVIDEEYKLIYNCDTVEQVVDTDDLIVSAFDIVRF